MNLVLVLALGLAVFVAWTAVVFVLRDRRRKAAPSVDGLRTEAAAVRRARETRRGARAFGESLGSASPRQRGDGNPDSRWL